MDSLGNEVVKNALENVNEAAKDTRLNENNDNSNAAANDTVLKAGDDTASSFVGLPIESLICAPIIAAAKGQQELTAVYIDNVMKLAYSSKSGDSSGDKTTNTLDFQVERPVQKDDGTVDKETVEIKAPLISLVPVPAFIMDELTVDFDMEVKNSSMESSETKSDVTSTVNYKSWFGLSANITGSVSSDTNHKRESDSSATYKIHAKAVQQGPSEGMAKLTALFTQMMEPIPAKSTSSN